MSGLPTSEQTVLPDGSVCSVEWFGQRSVLISRLVEGEVVWGQAFGGETVNESIERVRARMRARPDNYLSAQRRGV